MATLRRGRRAVGKPRDLLGDAEVVVRTFEGDRYARRKSDDDDVEGALAAASRVGKARVPAP